MDLLKIAKIVEAEASVLPYAGKLAVAQCVIDNKYNENAFTTPAEVASEESIEATHCAVADGERRFYGYELLQFRSFAKYGVDGGNVPDLEKIYGGRWAVPLDYSYLGSDSDSAGKWGHFYFGRRKQMRMLLIAGHGAGDPGAIGCGYKEADLARELVALIAPAAHAAGITVDVFDTSKNMYQYLKKGGKYDFTKYDYVLEVHFNASGKVDYTGNGAKMGSMFFIHPQEKGWSVEQKILNNLYALGSKKAWDGIVVSTRNYQGGLLVQNRVKSQGVSHGLLETCFISDMDDVRWYQSRKKEIAQAIVDGIADGFGVSTKHAVDDYMVRVKVPDLCIRKAPTVDAESVGHTGKGAFTIVEEATGKINKNTGELGLWGKLKSGAGYICLAYSEYTEKV